MVKNLSCTIICATFQLITAFLVQSHVLKFKLSAINLPNADLDSPSDPYVQLFRTTWTREDFHLNWEKFGETAVKPNTLNPSWDEVFEYEYFNGTTQKWGFLVKDLDDSWLNPFDDPLGRVEINVDDYMFQLKHSNSNEKKPVNYIQLFLSQPIGGSLLVTPVVEQVETQPEQESAEETPAPETGTR
ncbi:Copine-3 [Orchesella cincta]|uniref:Copine-3 n=1 Tax=Orchesella cincta TaxID=48709 RepID=A0A1D2NHM8_ORCCI|nr:Copine-3 [Orchesella cincta]